MNHQRDLPGLVFSCFSSKKKASEPLFTEHVLCYLLSGKIETFDGADKRVFGSGEFFFNKRNTLGRFLKYPADSQPYKSISFVLDKDFLIKLNIPKIKDNKHEHAIGKNILPISVDIHLHHFLNSLLPWFDEKMPHELMDLKKREAVYLILKTSPELYNVLFDYSEPGKIDLESFMNQNFMFNIDLPKLAYLTGRSLATFKRDFEKIFHMSPHRWIKIKRLQEACYLITEKKRKPNDIFVEVGFETLSHFSYAFKKYFGKNPSVVSK